MLAGMRQVAFRYSNTYHRLDAQTFLADFFGNQHVQQQLQVRVCVSASFLGQVQLHCNL